MKTIFFVALLICSLGGQLQAARDAEFKQIGSFLDSDGDFYALYNPEYTKAIAQRMAKKVIKGTAKFKPGAEANSQIPVIAQTVYQIIQATGIARIGCMGVSSKYVENFENKPYFISKSRLLLGATGKADYFSAFTGSEIFSFEEIGRLPEDTIIAAGMNIKAKQIYATAKRVGAFAMMSFGLEKEFSEGYGMPLEKVLDSIEGKCLIAAIGVSSPYIMVKLPDRNGSVFEMMKKIDSDFVQTNENTLVIASRDMTVMKSGETLTIYLGEAKPDLTKSLADYDFFKFFVSNVDEEGNSFMYTSPKIEHLLGELAFAWGNSLSFGLGVGYLSEKKFDYVRVDNKGISTLINDEVNNLAGNIAIMMGRLQIKIGEDDSFEDVVEIESDGTAVVAESNEE